MSSVKDAVKKIKDCISRDNSALFKKINKGATDEEIKELESSLKINLPNELKDFLSELNGLKISDSPIDYNSISDIKKHYQHLNSGNFDYDEDELNTPKEIKKELFNKHWIPIATRGGGDYICYDTVPGSGGKSGQLIEILNDEPRRIVFAESLSNNLLWYLKECQEDDIFSGIEVKDDDHKKPSWFNW